jgi:prepilin-type N-terminal cleavage/methylation domain-containing protein
MRRAYTLIELIIVVVLLGLAGALLVPYLSGRGDFDTQAAVRALISDIAFAQSDALANQGFRRVHFFADGRGWCLLRIDETQLNEPYDAATAQYVQDPLQGEQFRSGYIVNFDRQERYKTVMIESVSIDSGRRDLTFDELGGTVGQNGLPGTGGSVVLRSPDAAYRLDIAALTGKVRVTRLPNNG